MALAHGPRDGVCSARGCEEEATTGIVWRNPAIHRDRHKTWLACDEHRDFLLGYLRRRDFPARAVPLAEVGTAEDPAHPETSPGRPHRGRRPFSPREEGGRAVTDRGRARR